MWSLSDYKSFQGISTVKYLSSKSLDEYACKERQVRNLAFSWYSKNMEQGEIVYSSAIAGKWMPAQAGNVLASLLEIACYKENQ